MCLRISCHPRQIPSMGKREENGRFGMDMKASGYIMKPVTKADVERELFAVIFEDEPYDKKLQNLLQTYIFAMMKSLKAVGAEEAVVRSYNALAVNVDVLDCDYYRFQELDAGAVNAYETEYMSQYSWADFLYNGY